MLKIKSRTRVNDYIDRVEIEVDLPMNTNTLIKDLSKHDNYYEAPCYQCNGTGLKRYDEPFGMSEDKMHGFPYVKQGFAFCDKCYQGVIRICNYCGKELPRFRNICDCDYCQKLEANRIAELRNKTMNKASLVDNPELLKDVVYFYSEEHTDNDGYFQEWDEFFDKWYEHEEETKHRDGINRPMYVYLTKPLHFSIDADNVITDAIDNEDYYEDAYYSISNEKTKELQKLLDEWCKDCGVGITYIIDYSHKTSIPWDEYEKYIEKYYKQ